MRRSPDIAQQRKRRENDEQDDEGSVAGSADGGDERFGSDVAAASVGSRGQNRRGWSNRSTEGSAGSELRFTRSAESAAGNWRQVRPEDRRWPSVCEEDRSAEQKDHSGRNVQEDCRSGDCETEVKTSSKTARWQSSAPSLG